MKWDELQYNLMLALAVILPPLLLMLAYQDLEHNTQAAMQTCLELQAQYRAENPKCILSNQTVGLLDGEHALAWRTLK